MFGSHHFNGFGSVLEMVLPKGTAIHLRTKNDSGMLLLSNPAVDVQSFKTSIFFLDARMWFQNFNSVPSVF